MIFLLFTNSHNFDDFTNSGVHYKLKKTVTASSGAQLALEN